ncbi:MAG: FAD-dependent oxidoreductase [Gammaproteobacteria bacterium]|nr:FAD-dependent oxidoreductase [Gammaproteobacteria bacterium]
MSNNLQSGQWDMIVVGAGTTGLPAATFAAKRGGRVLLVEAADRIGGTLHLSSGQVSAAGTRLQAEKGIEDSPEQHLEEVIRISRGTINTELARLVIFNAAEAFDWMMELGFDVQDQCPSIESAHERYEVARYYWGNDFGLSVLDVLETAMREHEARGQIKVLTGTRVIGLLQDREGVVSGVELVDGEGVESSVAGKNVLLASGGYAANPAMFRRLCGYRLYVNGSYEFAQGDGYDLAVAAGGYLRGRENYLSNFGWLLEDGPYPKEILGRLNTFPESRPPWEIYVNMHGHRFVREDEPSVDAREHALLEQPELRYWVVFDDHIFHNAPPIVYDWSREQMAESFNTREAFRKADSLESLARSIGVSGDALANTVAEFNASVAEGSDGLGRRHLPAQIAKPPFYAIRQQGGSLSSTVGVAVNEKLQVMRPDGAPIPGLYAAGEILGSGQLQGNAFVGGMMVMPCIVFGRLLGQSLVEF